MAKKALKTTKKSSSPTMKRTTVNDAEIRQFDALGQGWWDTKGPMKPLHQLNPVRLEYMRLAICRHFDRDPAAMKVLSGLTVADIGCGGGLVTEPFCRMGGTVTGLDAGTENIKVAQNHAKAQKLDINYKATTVEALAATGQTYDIVTALEIVEHVSDVALFVEACCKLVNKNGILIMSTLNRTPKSFLLGIVAAEHILRWVPVGTHDWKKFLKPSELSREIEQHKMKVNDVCGLTYSPLTRRFGLDRGDLGVNYLMTATKKKN